MNVLHLPLGPDCWKDQKIIFCNHDATFQGDVILTRDAVVIIVEKSAERRKMCGGRLTRGTQGAQWRIVDENGGYWNTTVGRFVLPRESVTRYSSG